MIDEVIKMFYQKDEKQFVVAIKTLSLKERALVYQIIERTITKMANVWGSNPKLVKLNDWVINMTMRWAQLTTDHSTM